MFIVAVSVTSNICYVYQSEREYYDEMFHIARQYKRAVREGWDWETEFNRERILARVSGHAKTALDALTSAGLTIDEVRND